jgi:hypothetical protein
MASNDPTDTGGLFIGRRPGTAPLRYRVGAKRGRRSRQRADGVLAYLLLGLEMLLCLSLFGPQPVGWLWVGSQVEYLTGEVTAGLFTIAVGTIVTLFLTMVLAKRVDHAWKIVRRASGHDQQRGALERIFVASIFVAVVVFAIWFFLIEGPQPTLAPQD